MTINKVASFSLGVLLGTLLLLHVHIYGLGGAFNEGAYIDLPFNHFCGIEWQGTPGTFCDVDY